MKFIDVLNEYSFEVPRITWMKKQGNLWKSMYNDGLVDKNDTKKFSEFGKFFDSYYKKHKKFPSLQQCKKVLK